MLIPNHINATTISSTSGNRCCHTNTSTPTIKKKKKNPSTHQKPTVPLSVKSTTNPDDDPGNRKKGETKMCSTLSQLTSTPTGDRNSQRIPSLLPLPPCLSCALNRSPTDRTDCPRSLLLLRCLVGPSSAPSVVYSHDQITVRTGNQSLRESSPSSRCVLGAACHIRHLEKTMML